MRLLFVSQDFPPTVGGIQTYAAELSMRLAPLCEELVAVVPRADGAAGTDSRLDFKVYRPPSRDDLLGAFILPLLPFVACRHRPDVSFHAQWPTAGAALLSRSLTGFPRKIVVAAHGRELLFNPLLGRIYDRLRRSILTRVDRVVANSRFTAGLVKGLGVTPECISTVLPGTDPERFRPMDASVLRADLGLESKQILFTAGRLVRRKGIDTVIMSLAELARQFPDLVYLVGGMGEDETRLRDLARAEGVEDRVRFLGRIEHDQLAAYYNLADVFVMPSRDAAPNVEGFGIVYLEANACETPVVGAATGGVPDAIEDGETGLLVRQDDPIQLTRALADLLSDTDRARKMGREGRRRVLERFSWSHSADGLFAVLKEVVRGGGPAVARTDAGAAPSADPASPGPTPADDPDLLVP